MKKNHLRATWAQALTSFFAPIVLILLLRWLLIEPYVIPSGSMKPTLLVHDHIFVNKLAYGIHWPFSSNWILRWDSPQRGEPLVFRKPDNPEIFYIKRVQGVGGDELELRGTQLLVNGVEVTHSGGAEDGDYVRFQERNYTVQYHKDLSVGEFRTTVPEGHYFVLGDNRDESFDSRMWGFVPHDHLVGRPWRIWLSCHETLASAPFICDPKTLNFSRFLKLIQ